MKAADRSTSDGDKCERKDLSCEDRAGTIDEFCKRRHVQRGMHDHNSHREQPYSSEFHESAQIIPRGQQQPNRQRRSRKSI